VGQAHPDLEQISPQQAPQVWWSRTPTMPVLGRVRATSNSPAKARRTVFGSKQSRCVVVSAASMRRTTVHCELRVATRDFFERSREQANIKNARLSRSAEATVVLRHAELFSRRNFMAKCTNPEGRSAPFGGIFSKFEKVRETLDSATRSLFSAKARRSGYSTSGGHTAARIDSSMKHACARMALPKLDESVSD
jgi:hypothetical protein